MMKRQLVFVLLVLLLEHKVTYASSWTATNNQNLYLHGSTIGTPKVETPFQCYTMCEDIIYCASINMNSVDGSCELKHSTKSSHQHEKSNKPHILYMEVRDALGSTPRNPIHSCKWFKNLDSQVKSGVYWMKFHEPSSTPFQVFCDMTTDGGGWTLVYSYTITQYSSFISLSNAVTPIPNWPVAWSPSGWVPQSTTTPLNESSRSAMDFALWKKIGNELLFKSNITNWLACVEGTGSLVNWVIGSVTCRVVKAITSPCTDVAPNRLTVGINCGPCFFINDKYQYLLEGSRTRCWPVHDPCGTDPASSNHMTNVPDPSGAVYIR